MKTINTVEELEEQLSCPAPADISAMTELEGDILILGAGGKMGPTLALLARRAADEAGIKKRIIAVSRFADDDEPGCYRLETYQGVSLPHVSSR